MTISVITEIDSCYDETTLEDVINVLTHIKNGGYKGSSFIKLLIPQSLYVLKEDGSKDCLLEITAGHL